MKKVYQKPSVELIKFDSSLSFLDRGFSVEGMFDGFTDKGKGSVQEADDNGFTVVD